MRQFYLNQTTWIRAGWIVVGVLFMTAATLPAKAGYSQQALSGKKITLGIKDTSLEAVLKELREATGVEFTFNNTEMRRIRVPAAQFSDARLGNVLDSLLQGTGYTFRNAGESILIYHQKETSPALPSLSGVRAVLSDADLAVEVRGQVTDSSGAPLPGVTVSVKDAPAIGTTTDLNGMYILKAVPDGAVLVFSMVGFDRQEVSVTGRTEINIRLLPASNTLGETVVVAFGTQKKADVVGAVTTINPAELKVPASNLTTALAGRLAGVIAYQRSGEPGEDNADFFIRGVTTFGYKKDPLILIDGIETTTTDLARLQPDDIASFSIMKDATATSLYGSRAANGVILVTTKEGKEGKASISLRLENSLSTPTRNVELADPVTYMRLRNEAVRTRDPLGELPYMDQKIDNTIAGTNPYAYPATDWRDMLFKDYTMNQRANLNVSGGGQVARYYVAGSINQDNGMLRVDHRNNFNSNVNLKSYTLRTNVSVNISKSTALTFRLSGVFDDYTGPISGGADLYKKVMRTDPVLFPAYYPVDEEHRYVKHIMFGNYDDGSGGYYLNPYAEMVKGYKNYSRSNISAQFQINQDLNFLTKGLSARTMLNVQKSAYFDVTRQYAPFYYQASAYDKQTGTYALDLLNETSGTEYIDYKEGEKTVSSSFYSESALNYNRMLQDKHSLSGTLVFMVRQSLSGNAGNLQLSLPSRNVGLAGRATYSYGSRYYAELNFGYNASERFYKNHRWGFFPSAGVAWTVSNEKFWDPLKHVVNNLKLRGTYGITGNDAIGSPNDRFLYLSNVNMDDGNRGAVFGRDKDYSRSGVSISRYSDPNITWEVAKKTNLGLEVGLLGQVDIQADFYKERRSKILMPRSETPGTMGLQAQPQTNAGEAEGKGVDLSLDYNHSFNNQFWIQARANFTYAASKFIVYEEPDYSATPWKSHVGYSLNQQWGYIAERLFVDDAEVGGSARQNFGEVRGGDIKYYDINGDGQITTLDQAPIGYPTTPEIVYGFGFSIGYKDFDFSAFFQGLGRESFWINAKATAPFIPFLYDKETLPEQPRNQLLKAYADSHWSEDHRDLHALWPRLSDQLNENNTQQSTWFMRNGAFLRLKQVEIGYNLPEKAARRIFMERLRIYINSTNPLCWSRFKLWDVEMAGNGLGYPVQKVFNAGVLLSF